MTSVEEIWPDWHAEELLGRGAYGSVWRASRSYRGHISQSAVKIIEIPPEGTDFSAFAQMGMSEQETRDYLESMANDVMDEVAAMEAVKAALNVVSIEDYKLVEREPGHWAVGIRMELLECVTNHFARVGGPTPEDAARIGIDVCRALEACHIHEIIHRDIKPQNVFVTEYGDYKLGDFGIARPLDSDVTTVLSQKGTRSYMAPEVFYGRPYGSSVDIYSLGLMLYRFLNGLRGPFVEATTGRVTPRALAAAEDRRLRGEELPAPSGADPALAAIVLKACAPVPQDRWSSARRMREALEGWLAGERQVAEPMVVEAEAPDALSSQDMVTIDLGETSGSHASPLATMPAPVDREVNSTGLSHGAWDASSFAAAFAQEPEASSGAWSSGTGDVGGSLGSMEYDTGSSVPQASTSPVAEVPDVSLSFQNVPVDGTVLIGAQRQAQRSATVPPAPEPDTLLPDSPRENGAAAELLQDQSSTQQPNNEQVEAKRPSVIFPDGEEPDLELDSYKAAAVPASGPRFSLPGKRGGGARTARKKASGQKREKRSSSAYNSGEAKIGSPWKWVIATLFGLAAALDLLYVYLNSHYLHAPDYGITQLTFIAIGLCFLVLAILSVLQPKGYARHLALTIAALSVFWDIAPLLYYTMRMRHFVWTLLIDYGADLPVIALSCLVCLDVLPHRRLSGRMTVVLAVLTSVFMICYNLAMHDFNQDTVLYFWLRNIFFYLGLGLTAWRLQAEREEMEG